MKKLIATAAIAATGFAGLAGTANAAIIGSNLVAVDVDISNLLNDSLDDNQVIVSDLVDANVNAAVPVGIVANVCDVSAAVLLAGIDDGGTTTCDATNSQRSQQGVRQLQRFQASN